MQEAVPATIVLQPSGDRGLGTFAARSFSAGEVLVCEEALTISTPSFSDANRRLWKALYENLKIKPIVRFAPTKHLGALVALRDMGADACRTNLLKLSGADDQVNSRAALKEIEVLDCLIADGALPETARISADEYARLRQVFKKNSFEYAHNINLSSQAKDAEQLGDVIFLQASRVNHSCCPNLRVDFDWDDEHEKLMCRLVAIANIAEGEEVFYSYRQNPSGEEHKGISRRQRRKWLLRHFDFNCACPGCNS